MRIQDCSLGGPADAALPCSWTTLLTAVMIRVQLTALQDYKFELLDCAFKLHDVARGLMSHFLLTWPVCCSLRGWADSDVAVVVGLSYCFEHREIGSRIMI